MRVLFALLLPALLAAQRKPGNPLDHLPGNIEILTHFGERADISPDNQSVAFMAKSFGDAFVIDLKTRVIRCLTCNLPGAAFLRVMHLVTGDYILIGPARFEDVRTSRSRDNELWFLSRQPGSKPVRLDERMSEGAAISKKSLRIAYSQTLAQGPLERLVRERFSPSERAASAPEAPIPVFRAEFPNDYSRLVVAELDLSGGVPKLRNKRMVYESRDRSCFIEAQDFYDNDRKMTFTCYEPPSAASVMGIDLETGQVTNFSKAPGTYNEPEGIWPDGEHTCVESDRQTRELGGRGGPGQIDIWKLKLDGTGANFVRLTRFNDYEGGKASNPVVSTDGRFMAFQAAHSADEAGVGYGILLYHIK
ncbi:MAG: hypothetical protein ABSD27_03310 [Bryobacteraceae bacterium]|jgi:hypothetical protein